MINSIIRVGGVDVSSAILLGAGVIKSPLQPELASYLSEPTLGAVSIGSVTPGARDGNTGVLNWPEVKGAFETYKTEGGLHANGMRNLGIVGTLDALPKRGSKTVILSIAGYSTEDFVVMLKAVMSHKHAHRVSAIEINSSCPTMAGEPIAYSLTQLKELCVALGALNCTIPLWLKLSPYFTEAGITALQAQYPDMDLSHAPRVSDAFVPELAALLKEHTALFSALIVSNGLPHVGHQADIRVERADGTVSTVAGLSGAALKENNIATIRTLRSLGLTTDIIGCGGVLTKKDAADYLDAGAKAVQCTGGPVWGGGADFFKNFN